MTPQTAKRVRIGFDIFLVLFGVCFMTGIIDASPSNFWLPWLLTIVGIFVLSTENVASFTAGLTITGIGLFMVLRSAGIITLPWFRYLIGVFLMTLGIVNLLRNARGGDVPITATFRKSKDDK